MSERWKPSVTVAAIAGRERGGRLEYLMVEETTADGVRLNNPAGHLEPGESPQQAVAREALEETARVFVPERLLGVYLTRSGGGGFDSDTTYLRIAFTGTAADADPTRHLDDGIVRSLWLTLEELRASQPRHRSPLVLRCVEDAAAGRGEALDLVVTDASIYTSP